MWHFIRWYKFLSAVKIVDGKVIKTDIAMTFMLNWQHETVNNYINSKEEWRLEYE